MNKALSILCDNFCYKIIEFDKISKFKLKKPNIYYNITHIRFNIKAIILYLVVNCNLIRRTIIRMRNQKEGHIKTAIFGIGYLWH